MPAFPLETHPVIKVRRVRKGKAVEEIATIQGGGGPEPLDEFIPDDIDTADQ